MPKSPAHRLVAGLVACITALAVATLVAAWSGSSTMTVMAAPAPVSQAPSTSFQQVVPGTTLGGLQQQMLAMQRIHDRVVQASDADARRALMPEHLIAMQTGMAMLNARPAPDDEGESDVRKARPMYADLPARATIEPLHMELQFMQLLIQMMLDRLPPA
jgi:hypothetical protein